MITKDNIKNIRWFGHSGFLIQEKPIIYIDPYDLAFPDIGDLILITQNHAQKCAPEDVKWLRKGSTIIVASEDCAGIFEGDVRLAKAGDVIHAKSATIEVLPISDEVDSNGKGRMGVGYNIIFPNGLRIYHTGCGAKLSAVSQGITDILFLPVGRSMALNAQKAAEVANRIKPEVVIPFDWETSSRDTHEIQIFKELCEVPIESLKPKR